MSIEIPKGSQQRTPAEIANTRQTASASSPGNAAASQSVSSSTNNQQRQPIKIQVMETDLKRLDLKPGNSYDAKVPQRPISDASANSRSRTLLINNRPVEVISDAKFKPGDKVSVRIEKVDGNAARQTRLSNPQQVSAESKQRAIVPDRKQSVAPENTAPKDTVRQTEQKPALEKLYKPEANKPTPTPGPAQDPVKGTRLTTTATLNLLRSANAGAAVTESPAGGSPSATSTKESRPAGEKAASATNQPSSNRVTPGNLNILGENRNVVEDSRTNEALIRMRAKISSQNASPRAESSAVSSGQTNRGEKPATVQSRQDATNRMEKPVAPTIVEQTGARQSANQTIATSLTQTPATNASSFQTDRVAREFKAEIAKLAALTESANLPRPLQSAIQNSLSVLATEVSGGAGSSTSKSEAQPTADIQRRVLRIIAESNLLDGKGSSSRRDVWQGLAQALQRVSAPLVESAADRTISDSLSRQSHRQISAENQASKLQQANPVRETDSQLRQLQKVVEQSQQLVREISNANTALKATAIKTEFFLGNISKILDQRFVSTQAVEPPIMPKESQAKNDNQQPLNNLQKSVGTATQTEKTASAATSLNSTPGKPSTTQGAADTPLVKELVDTATRLRDRLIELKLQTLGRNTETRPETSAEPTKHKPSTPLSEKAPPDLVPAPPEARTPIVRDSTRSPLVNTSARPVQTSPTVTEILALAQKLESVLQRVTETGVQPTPVPQPFGENLQKIALPAELKILQILAASGLLKSSPTSLDSTINSTLPIAPNSPSKSDRVSPLTRDNIQSLGLKSGELYQATVEQVNKLSNDKQTAELFQSILRIVGKAVAVHTTFPLEKGQTLSVKFENQQLLIPSQPASGLSTLLRALSSILPFQQPLNQVLEVLPEVIGKDKPVPPQVKTIVRNLLDSLPKSQTFQQTTAPVLSPNTKEQPAATFSKLTVAVKQAIQQSGVFAEQRQSTLVKLGAEDALKQILSTNQASGAQPNQAKNPDANLKIPPSPEMLLRKVESEKTEVLNASKPNANSSKQNSLPDTRLQQSAESILREHQRLEAERLLARDLKVQLSQLFAALKTGQPLPESDGRLLSPITAAAEPQLLNMPFNFPQLITPSTPIRKDFTYDDANVGILLRLLAGALNRIQFHQLSSAHRALTESNDQTTVRTVQMEVPFLTGEKSIDPFQIRIDQEAPQKDRNVESEQKKRWLISLAFDLAPLGPMYVQASLIDERLGLTIWAESPAALRLINKEAPSFRDKLTEIGLDVQELQCRRGTPVGTKTRIDQHLVDIEA